MKPDAASLDRLHDIIAPPPVPWWPPAPGWSWLLGFALLIAFGLLLRGIIHWQHNRYRREALAELARLQRDTADAARRASALAGLSELLKRTALTAFPRQQVASLTGAEWFAFLDRTGGTTFANGPGSALQNVVNDPRAAAEWNDERISEAVEMVRQWIRHHRTDQERSDKSPLPDSEVRRRQAESPA